MTARQFMSLSGLSRFRNTVRLSRICTCGLNTAGETRLLIVVADISHNIKFNYYKKVYVPITTYTFIIHIPLSSLHEFLQLLKIRFHLTVTVLIECFLLFFILFELADTV